MRHNNFKISSHFATYAIKHFIYVLWVADRKIGHLCTYSVKWYYARTCLHVHSLFIEFLVIPVTWEKMHGLLFAVMAQ